MAEGTELTTTPTDPVEPAETPAGRDPMPAWLPRAILLAVGAVSPRKGYDVLVEALAPLAGGDWHLTIAGSAERDTETAGAVRKAILGAGLRAQVSLAGTVTDAELARLYARADVFVLSSRYEGYGMVLAEAMARGLAIVTTTGGAAAETVPDAAALKVSPDDAAALSAALARMLAEPDLRKRLGDASWLAGQQLPRWETTVARIAGVLKRVAAAADGGAVVGSGHRD